MLDKIKFRNKIIKSSIIFSIMTLSFFSTKTLSIYKTEAYSSDKTSVAKWENNIEFLEKPEYIIDNKKGNITTLKFNVLSNSEVSSKYNLNFGNIPIGLGIIIENDKHIRKLYINNEEITVTFDEITALFDKKNTSVINDISYTLTKEENKEILTFNDQINNTSIKVELIDGKQNITFYNFEQLLPGKVTREHLCTFEVLTDEFLVSTLDITTYATFEQLD